MTRLDTILDLIDAQLAEVDMLTEDPGEERTLVAPRLPADVEVGPGDLERAETLLAELRDAEARIVGLRRRIAGEIAGMRRPTRAPKFTAPRLVDTSI